jgi:transposase
MPNERISMSKLKQLIGLQSSNLSVRALSRALGLSVGAVSKYLNALRACGIDAAEAQALSETELESRVFGAAMPQKPPSKVAPDCAWIHAELKRHRHVTLQLLWEEYRAEHGEAAYQRSAFCRIYREWERRLKRSMRQRHFAGEKLFVDYAGRTVPIYGGAGRVAFQAQLFIAAMGASGCAYAEATRTQTLSDWLGSHVRALEFYGAAPTIIVPDNPKVGVTRADRYEPDLQRSYEEMAAHYRCVVIPAPLPAEGQEPGRTERPAHLPLDPGEAATSAVLEPGRTQHGDPAATDALERSSVPTVTRIPAQRLRSAGPARDAGAAGERLYVRRMERAQRGLRLPR